MRLYLPRGSKDLRGQPDRPQEKRRGGTRLQQALLGYSLLLLAGCSINNHAVKLRCYGPFELKHLQEPDLAPPPSRIAR